MIEPYRIFFSIGFVSSVIGTFIWIMFFGGLSPNYPALAHSNLMFFAFLLSFVAGFLLTAVPKMSLTNPATKHEMICYSVLAFMQVLFSFAPHPQWSYLIAVFQFLFLIRFVLIRFFKRKQNPPSGFIYVPMGLLMGLMGSVFAFCYYYGSSEHAFLISFAKLFLYQGFILNLIAGLGGRLIPTLSRTVGALSPMTPGKLDKVKYILPMMILNISIIMEGLGALRVGNAMRFFVLLYIVITQFKIFEPKHTKSYMGVLLTIASLFLVFPYLFIAIFPAYKIDLLHLVYIGGFSLMTYLIAVRVVLAHGGHSLSYELKSKSLWTISIFLIISSLLRFSVSLSGSTAAYSHALLTASIFWIIGVMIWFFTIGLRLIKIS